MATHSDNTLRMLYHFLVDIGAKPDLVSKDERRDYMVRLYDTICTDNPMFPKEDESKVWASWTTAVLNGSAGRRGNNLSALLQCFNDWIRREMPRFRPAPDYEIQDNTPTKLEGWTDEMLLDQLSIIKRVGEGSTAWLGALRGTDSYLNRLHKEINKRKLTPEGI